MDTAPEFVMSGISLVLALRIQGEKIMITGQRYKIFQEFIWYWTLGNKHTPFAL
ncbi:MAG: hypothetical protein L6V92_10835 [Phocaeicola vulgatus]|nr:MAG: hypothetical protein L6V92_10835 [Phocaeicola vulgatus]